MPDRIDKTLVKLNYVDTRSQAQDLIANGVVFYEGKLVKKSSLTVHDDSLIEVKGSLEYVGRGAHKIQGASHFFQVSFKGKLVADVGASTGGFTDFALSQGAIKVFAIDVGHNQLAEKLKKDKRVVNLEGTNIRYPLELDEKVDIAVVDLSYISLRLTLPTIFSLLNDKGIIVCLVKPQFEIGKEGLGKNGVVKRTEDHLKVLSDLYLWCEESHFFIANFCASPIVGRSGNKEFFFMFDKTLSSHSLEFEEIRSFLEQE